MAEWVISRLRAAHDRADFSCGKPALDTFLRSLVSQYEKRGQGLGETLLMHALRSALELSEKLGVFAVDVWVIDEEERAFYHKYRFISLEDHPPAPVPARADDRGDVCSMTRRLSWWRLVFPGYHSFPVVF